MKVIIYSTKKFEKEYLAKANTAGYELSFVSQTLSTETAFLAKGYDAAVIGMDDDASVKPLEALKQNGIKFIVIRTAEYGNIDIKKASELKIRVSNIPSASTEATAEFTIAMILALNRKLVTADRQVHNNNFSAENLVGFNLYNKTVGIIGTGKTGAAVGKILHGFGCKLIAYDPYPDIELTRNYHVNYVGLEQLCSASDIITIHTALNPGTKYLIDKSVISEMKPGAMLINTGRGPVVNTVDVYDALKDGHIGYFGADVYEHEKGIFLYDRTGAIPGDALLEALAKMPNVLITPHIAPATKEALANVAEGCFTAINCWQNNQKAPYELTLKTRGN